jgi:8-oxo-dGTP diphosphatase
MIDVTCAIIWREGKILTAQRGANKHLAGKWEFPGGKVADGESKEDSIVREIEEELGCIVQPLRRLSDSIYNYGDKQIRLIPFECDLVKGEPIAKEHATLMWCERATMQNLDWCEADISIVSEILSSR